MHVFVSHASRDSAVALEYVEAIEQAGLAAWVAPRDLSPGTDYAQSISEAIRGAGTFLLLCSDASLASSDVRNEFELAKRRGTQVIPVRLPDSADPLDNVTWEYHLLRLQIVAGTDPAATVARLLPVLRPALAANPATSNQDPSVDEPTDSTSEAAEDVAAAPRTPQLETRLFDVWDRATRTISKLFENEKVLPRQKLDGGGGFRWFHLTPSSDGPYASVEFMPANLGTEASPLWFVLHEKTPEFSTIRHHLQASSVGKAVKQTHNGVRVALPYAAEGPVQDAVDHVVDVVVELRNLGVP